MKPVIVIGGPTASGKSALAAAVGERLGGAVVNADSMQVYRGLEIISAAPGIRERARCPHRLYGVLDPAEACSAGKWRSLAVAEIDQAHAEGLLPVVAGGTGLYLRSLIAGIDKMPPVLAEIRETIRSRMAVDGPEVLYQELVRSDPDTAARLEPADRQRIARALEIYEATGRRLSDWQTGAEHSDDNPYVFLTMLVLPERQALYRDCDSRFLAMMENGVMDEVKTLAECALDPQLPAMKALGIPHLIAHLRGEIPLEDAIDAAQQATRRYVKRQFTWFKHQIIADISLYEKYSEKMNEKIFPEIRKFLLTNPV